MSGTHVALPWQRQLWSQVWRSAEEGRLSHALLLAGPRGIGKREFARALADSLLCEARSAEGLACGQCRSCAQLRAGSHPNLQWLKPEVDDRTGKEKRDISIEQIRLLTGKLALSSHYGQAKIAVIEPADALNTNGVNALLKTIEEPPPGGQLLLISERPMALPATLRSRCQRLRFAAPTHDEALAWLRQEHPQVQEEALIQARGAPLAAVALHESGLLPLQIRWQEQMVRVAARKLDPVAAAAEIIKDKEQFSAWLEWALGWFGKLLRLRLVGNGADTPLATRIEGAGLELLLNETTESLRRIRQNANPQLTVESLMILWWRSTRSAA